MPVVKHRKAKKVLKGMITFLLIAAIIVFLYLIFSSKFLEGYNALKGQ
jgi:succinate dehydrogenase hydrophobic anchor subunit